MSWQHSPNVNPCPILRTLYGKGVPFQSLALQNALEHLWGKTIQNLAQTVFLYDVPVMWDTNGGRIYGLNVASSADGCISDFICFAASLLGVSKMILKKTARWGQSRIRKGVARLFKAYSCLFVITCHYKSFGEKVSHSVVPNGGGLSQISSNKNNK